MAFSFFEIVDRRYDDFTVCEKTTSLVSRSSQADDSSGFAVIFWWSDQLELICS